MENKPAENSGTLSERINSTIAAHPLLFTAGITLAGLGIGFLISLEAAAIRMAQAVDAHSTFGAMTNLHYPNVGEIFSSIFKANYDERDFIFVGQTEQNPPVRLALDARYYFNYDLPKLTSAVGLLFGSLKGYSAWANAREEKSRIK